MVITAIGFCTCLAGLLRSQPDAISPLSGVELVARKVKLVAYQGGWYAPRHQNNHTTFNWDCGGSIYKGTDCVGTAQFVVANMPSSVEQVFNDVGDEVMTGGELSYCQVRPPSAVPATCTCLSLSSCARPWILRGCFAATPPPGHKQPLPLGVREDAPVRQSAAELGRGHSACRRARRWAVASDQGLWPQ